MTIVPPAGTIESAFASVATGIVAVPAFASDPDGDTNSAPAGIV